MASRSWGDSGGGWESASGSSYEESIYEQYDYDSDWSETFDAEGTATTSASADNEVSGWVDTSNTEWLSWSSGCGSGSGSCSGTSGGGSWTSSWGDSYSETVSYPGFYHAGYSGGGDHRGYIGDDYGGASGGGYFMVSQSAPESLFEDDSPDQSAQQEPLTLDHRPEPRGRGLVNRRDDHPGQGPAAPESQHPGQGQSILHQRSPVWDNNGEEIVALVSTQAEQQSQPIGRFPSIGDQDCAFLNPWSSERPSSVGFMDEAIRRTQQGAIIVACVAGTAAGGFAAIGVNPVVWGGAASTAGSAAAVAVNANKLWHVFGNPGHKGLTGLFQVVVNVGRGNATVKGAGVKGIAQIGTFFIR